MRNVVRGTLMKRTPLLRLMKNPIILSGLTSRPKLSSRVVRTILILEERDGDFFCDCSLGFKGHLCDHTLGMHFRQETGRLEASEQVGVFLIPTK